jgi:Dolichyl-phosphate-mannose-protein mannosyltransferase
MSTSAPDSLPDRRWLSGGMALVVLLAAVKLVIHCYYNNRYDFFRDEFDYLACARHLAWGYVDQPPLVPFLARLSLVALGDSLRAIRFLPALAMSATVVLTAMIARQLAGRASALILAAAAVAVAPVYLAGASLLLTNDYEPILWSGCAYLAILAVKRNEPRYWLWFGMIAGLGLMEKYSIAFFIFGVLAGLLMTEQRRVFFNKWIWLGGLAALAICLPNILWNIHYDYPFLQLMHNIKATGRDIQLSPIQYFSQQCILMQPLAAPLWIAGVCALLFCRLFRPYRFLGWSYVVTFAIFTILHGKNYYLAPIYPMLFAAGAVVFEHAVDRPKLRWLPYGAAILVLGGGIWAAPLAMPIVPADKLEAFLDRFPIKVPRSEHSHLGAALPQHFADQFGWREIVSEVNIAWQRIPEVDREDCAIFAQDYGQAGAIDWFGPKYGLPASLSGHQSWFLWGPRHYSGNCLIVLDDRAENLQRLFNRVELVGYTPDNPYALEKNLPVFICTDPKRPGWLREEWIRLKRWR